MAARLNRKAVWGWMFFDWAAQPFHTLIITFVFAPYFVAHVIGGDAARGQAIWGYAMAAAGVTIALLSPVMGAVADSTGGRRRTWIACLSVLHVVSAAWLWTAEPGTAASAVWPILVAVAVGLATNEIATTFVNAYLPEIAPGDIMGEVSGSGWGFGYVGGLVSLIAVLVLVAENADGVTLLGHPPIGGLDPSAFEGTRAVGPIAAIWYVVFVIPFFLWVPDSVSSGPRRTVAAGLRDLGATLRALPARPALATYLASAMFFRDALNGVFAFGGIYAVGVLGWSVVQIGVFGIAAAATGALGAWLGGRLDRAWGPRPVLIASILILTAACLVVIAVTRENVFGATVAPGSGLPDAIFMACGMVFGAAGGSLQSAGRTALVGLADRSRMTEAFGLYAFSGRATAFLAPLSIALVTDATGSQRAGMLPVVALFAIALVLLLLVRPRKKEEHSLATP